MPLNNPILENYRQQALLEVATAEIKLILSHTEKFPDNGPSFITQDAFFVPEATNREALDSCMCWRHPLHIPIHRLRCTVTIPQPLEHVQTKYLGPRQRKDRGSVASIEFLKGCTQVDDVPHPRLRSCRTGRQACYFGNPRSLDQTSSMDQRL